MCKLELLSMGCYGSKTTVIRQQSHGGERWFASFRLKFNRLFHTLVIEKVFFFKFSVIVRALSGIT